MFWFLIPFLLASTTAESLTAEEYSQLPRLFHLDDYDKCLSVRDGLYCLGVFELTATHKPHNVYELMKKHTEGVFNFNRTLIHRGYCLNKRCPSRETNTTKHFEQCANVWAKSQAMRANLRTLHYCRTAKDLQATIPRSNEQELFLQVCYAILFLNIVGTAYDLMTGTKQNKNKLLMAWSVPANWHKLTVIHKGGDARLTALEPVQGAKVVGIFCVMYAHNYAYHYGFHVTNPDFLEQMPVRSAGLFLSNGMLLVHMFFMITSFLTAYNMLLYSEKRPLNVRMLPLLLIKRISRVSPLHMLVIGYAATWWPNVRDGPLITSTIGKNSQTCIQKFWTHVFFVNNIMDKEKICLTPTWYLAVDLHLYTLVCFLTIFMWRYKRYALVIYSALFFGSCIFNAVACYIHNWKSFVFFASPENIRTVFENVESFTHFYISTWGALAGCFLGMFMAHVQFEIQRKSINCNDYKLAVLIHNISLPLGVVWIIKSGKFALNLTTPAEIAIFVAVERAIILILLFIILLGSFNINGPVRKIFAWSRWHAMSRMSLAVLLLHWVVGMVIAARPVPYASSIFDVIVDWLATIVITYILAVPATVLLEIPFQRCVDAILSFS